MFHIETIARTRSGTNSSRNGNSRENETANARPVLSKQEVKQSSERAEEGDGWKTSNFMDQYSAEQLREMQLKDSDLRPVISWLEAGQDPSQNELQLQSPASKQLWLCRSQLLVKDGTLHYKWDHGDRISQLLVVPESLKEEILKMYHDAQIGGHLGRDKTLAKIKQSFYWPRMKLDVAIYIAGCAKCSCSKRPQRSPRAPLQNYQAGHPNDRVHMDILGPFTESYRGNKYVLMIVDQFTRWVEMVPLPSQNAEMVAGAFFEHYVVRFGAPFMIHTDQGRNFESDLFQAFCSLLEITKTRTTPYRPSSNGQVERYNQLVLNFLRCYLAGKQREWDKYLPVLGMSIRAMENRSTGFTPNMLRLGQEITLPADILFGVRGQGEYQSCAEYLRFLVQRLKTRRYGRIFAKRNSDKNGLTMLGPKYRALMLETLCIGGVQRRKLGRARSSILCTLVHIWSWGLFPRICTGWQTGGAQWCCTTTSSNFARIEVSHSGFGGNVT